MREESFFIFDHVNMSAGDRTLVTGPRLNSTRTHIATRSTEKTGLPARILSAPEPLGAPGALMYDNTSRSVYYSNGAAWHKIPDGGTDAAKTCIVDADGDTSVCVDDGTDNDTIELTTPAGGGVTIAAGSAGLLAVAGFISLVPAGGQTFISGTTLIGPTPSPITMATVLTKTSSGQTLGITAGVAPFMITLPTPVANPGLNFRFVLTTVGAGSVTVSGAPMFGTILTPVGFGPLIAAPSVTFMGGAAAPGDSVEVWSDGIVYMTRAITGAPGGIGTP